MILHAAFACHMNDCRIVKDAVFVANGSCVTWIWSETRNPIHPKDGRYPIPGTDMWYECRAMHVDDKPTI